MLENYIKAVKEINALQQELIELDNKMKDEIDLDYIKTDDLFDFKVLKTQKKYTDNNFNLDIEKYGIIYASEFKK